VSDSVYASHMPVVNVLMSANSSADKWVITELTKFQQTNSFLGATWYNFNHSVW